MHVNKIITIYKKVHFCGKAEESKNAEKSKNALF